MDSNNRISGKKRKIKTKVKVLLGIMFLLLGTCIIVCVLKFIKESNQSNEPDVLSEVSNLNKTESGTESADSSELTVWGNEEPAEADIPSEDTDTFDEEELVSDEWYIPYCKQPDKKVDFDNLRDKCPDVYAWIVIPNTNINYPIAYCDAVSPFYWDHDIDGKPSENGMIITDSLNSMDFSEPMTLIYGKNTKDKTMFSQLHKFRDSVFFDENDVIKIYIDDVLLEYKVFATYIYPNKQILQEYRFDDPLSFTEYFNKVKDIRDLSMQIREENWPNYDDHVITLVTHCDNENERLFVQAVLKTSTGNEE